MPMFPRPRLLLAPMFLLLVSAALAQGSPADAPRSPAAPASAAGRDASVPPRVAPPARAASAAARPAAAASAPADTQRIEITGGRESDTEQRRQSTASKIVIGREEIDKFGDATVGEVLRRLPGVTTPGAPGRGGPPRMRGLGNGFTQLLIDGQRIPPGFSLESLTPEQVERIEVLRAPTAETGARAIAGTINIITREGYRRRLNDLRIGFGRENGKLSPGVNWTHNDSAGDLTYNVSGSLFRPRRESSSTSRTTVQAIDSGALLEDRSTTSDSLDRRFGSNLTSRLQWRLNDTGDMLALTPSIFHTKAHSDGRSALRIDLARPTCTPQQVLGCSPELYDRSTSVNDSRFTNARLGAQWRQRLGPARMELNAGGGRWRAVNDTTRLDFRANQAAVARTFEDRSRSRENSANLNLKASGVAGGNEQGGEHTLVGGLEVDSVRRTETRSTLQNGQPLLVDFGDNLQASSLRLAAYGQDEWTLSPNWSAYAGLRWEGIATTGDSGNGDKPTNRSSVWTPLLHAVWKPDPKSRDQVRVSLTRAYRSPNLGALIARPSINRDFDPTLGPNIVTRPDTAGNPALKPELSTGVDLALERYLEAGGVLSASLFHRSIGNLMRNVTTLESVTWSPYARYVRRMRNVGDATTSGLETDAKFRLDQMITGATPVELRANLAFYTSRVQGVPGPDNRLDEQAHATGNLGGDYRLRGLPLTLGGNVNWVPGYTTRTDAFSTGTVGTKVIWDSYALWTFDPAVALRLLANNLAPRDYATGTSIDVLNERTTSRNVGPSYLNLQLRLELKL